MYLLDLFWERPSFGVFAYFMALAEVLALMTVPSVLLRRSGRPKAALSWLLALFALPAIGVFTWWAIGRSSIERRKRKRKKSALDFENKYGRPHSEAGTPFERWMPPRALGESIFPTHQNSVRLLFDGKNAYPAMEAAIAGAKRSVHALFYIWHRDASGQRFRDLLARKAKEGVAVRVLVDAWGARKFAGSFSRPIVEAGGHVAEFMPTRFSPLQPPRFNFINHRKILVVDEQVAFTGGMNIGDEYAHDWRDVMAEIRGPAVRSLEHVFLDDWNFATKGKATVGHSETAPNVPSGNVPCAIVASGPDQEAWIHDAFFTALTRSEHRIWLVTPYFIPSLALMAALRTAANRGVDVRIVLPATSDVPIVKYASRSYYLELLEAGAHIYECRGTMIHAKAFVVDDRLTSLGSANMDSRSFRLSFEIGCFFIDEDINRQLADWIRALMSDSDEIDWELFENRSNAQQLLESTAHLLSPLL